jgi:hypothetical protein|tara:strand:- start:274 stop:528 length:255 start_codon:yes stop_codon:yes gene_type:complete
MKQLTIISAFMVLVGGHAQIDRLTDSIMPLNLLDLGGTIIAPYVPTEPVGPFIGQTQCKVSNKDKPVIEQLNECKKQRIGWLKI